ncbi:DUF6904 family protein [Anaerophaga thermohalophila]|jgi:hypothetical protein|uniref:DUF6904 family protein n=1 Tax=Anaerophaga thermohalophila TaxID=177400 RepID=UPI0002F1C95D|nr:hypothetical protein [Anaerophaga thermohalophila]
MLHITPTPRGIGIKLWGTHEDLNSFYEVIGKYWGEEKDFNLHGSENRDKLISSFSYEVRKAYEGLRLKKKSDHPEIEAVEYFGTKISWVHILFFLAALKFNMRYSETTRFDIAMLLQVEYWLEKAMKVYDPTGARKLAGFIEGGIYEANEYIYHYMRSINMDFFILGGGKKAFRQLPRLLNKAVFYTDEYNAYRTFLEKEAKRLGCNVNDMEIDDDEVDYEGLRW